MYNNFLNYQDNMTEKEKERTEHLKNLKKGDFIWVVRLHPIFKTYGSRLPMDNTRYLGCSQGDEDADYDDSIRVIEAKSPEAYSPTKMAFVAKMINGECKDDIAYVFSSSMHDFEWGDFRFGQHIILPHDHFRGYKSQDFYLSAINFKNGITLSMKDVFFSEQDCIKECRKRNNAYHSCKTIDCIGKTLNSLKKQFNAFKKSDVYVDAKEQIEKDLDGNKK